MYDKDRPFDKLKNRQPQQMQRAPMGAPAHPTAQVGPHQPGMLEQ